MGTSGMSLRDAQDRYIKACARYEAVVVEGRLRTQLVEQNGATKVALLDLEQRLEREVARLEREHREEISELKRHLAGLQQHPIDS